MLLFYFMLLMTTNKPNEIIQFSIINLMGSMRFLETKKFISIHSTQHELRNDLKNNNQPSHFILFFYYTSTIYACFVYSRYTTVLIKINIISYINT